MILYFILLVRYSETIDVLYYIHICDADCYKRYCILGILNIILFIYLDFIQHIYIYITSYQHERKKYVQMFMLVHLPTYISFL